MKKKSLITYSPAKLAELKKKKKLNRLPQSRIAAGASAQLASSNSQTLTIFEIGNIEYGILPTTEDLNKYRDLVKKVVKSKENSLFVPGGLVRVTQYTL